MKAKKKILAVTFLISLLFICNEKAYTAESTQTATQKSPQEKVRLFREKLKLRAAATYIEKPDLSPESNALLNIADAVAAYYAERGKEEDVLSKEKALEMGRQSYLLITDNFAGTKSRVQTKDFTIDSPSTPVKVRMYKKDESADTPLIIYTHGGGWTRGNLDTHNTLCAKLCFKTGWNVLAIDYRLSPENLHPAALEDMNVVYQWALKGYKTILMAGDSAGGNLTTAFTLKLRQDHVQEPKGLFLFYPALDLRLITDE